MDASVIKLSIQRACWILVVVALTFAVHEAAHGIASWALGYPTFVRVNSSGLLSGDYRSVFDRDLTSAVGPLITIVQAIVGTLLVGILAWRPGFVLVFAGLLMRVLATVASLRKPNDEARLGLSWGLGYWTIHALVVLVLLGMTCWCVRKLNLSARELAGMFGWILVGMIIVILAESSMPTLRL